ncbi:MAG TPA: nucleotidyltransferase domain-containing protein [Pseudonocardiaceae bacterium]|nr:nucleotidyltransferase domain-containing protein [Pseudonocardiaceae bacterium]
MSVPLTSSERLGPMVPLVQDDPAQWIADQGMMLRVLVGSGVHGMSIDGQDDRDEMGVCVEPPSTVIGSGRFENYAFRTQPEGVRPGPGDLDLMVYSLRKYAYLASSGNPTVLLPLFVRDEHIRYVNDWGRELRGNRSLFISKRAGTRFIGYLNSQRRGLLGFRSGGSRNQGQADIRARYGFDTKFAIHMVRLGFQGVELLRTGEITLPVPEPELSWLRALRRGEHTKDDALERAEQLVQEITQLMESSWLPDKPDHPAIDSWLESVHRRYWGW